MPFGDLLTKGERRFAYCLASIGIATIPAAINGVLRQQDYKQQYDLQQAAIARADALRDKFQPTERWRRIVEQQTRNEERDAKAVTNYNPFKETLAGAISGFLVGLGALALIPLVFAGVRHANLSLGRARSKHSLQRANFSLPEPRIKTASNTQNRMIGGHPVRLNNTTLPRPRTPITMNANFGTSGIRHDTSETPDTINMQLT